MARLIVKHRGEVRREIEIRPGMLIGRDVDADILIGPPASRQHARIEHDGAAFVLRDLNSKAGTFIGGRRVVSVQLADGMEIVVGEYALVFRDPTMARESAEGWQAGGDREPPLDVVATIDAAVPVFSHWIEASQTTAKLGLLQQHLQTLHDIGNAIASKHDVESLLEEAVQRLSLALPGDHRGFLALCEQPDGELTIRILKMSGDQSPVEMLSHTIARRAMGARQSILCRDAREEFQSSASVQAMELGSVMCVPLVLPDRVIGILQWDASGTTGAFSRDDLNLVTGIASLLAVALENARLCDALRAAKSRADMENVRLRRAGRRETSLACVIGDSEGIEQARGLARQMMSVNSSVLVTGETGSGKELLARAIHDGSARTDKPFIAVNCAAIPESLLESELFGIEKGTATGVDSHIGKIEQADGGTLFLDEVGDMSLAMQAKLLRTLEERTVERLGGDKAIDVDIRLIAATHRDLVAAIASKEFREDLYYRLKVVEIPVPPLRERGRDILALAEHFLAAFALDMGKSLPGFAPAAETRLLSYEWPGNVRELRNAVERAAALAADGERIDLDLLPAELTGSEAELIDRHKRRGRLDSALASLEREMIEAALKETGGNRTKAAERLGISREGLRLKLSRYGISPQRSSSGDTIFNC